MEKAPGKNGHLLPYCVEYRQLDLFRPREAELDGRFGIEWIGIWLREGNRLRLFTGGRQNGERFPFPE